MEYIKCKYCNEPLEEEDSEMLNWNIKTGIMERENWGFCPKCGRNFTWRERYLREKFFEFEEE